MFCVGFFSWIWYDMNMKCNALKKLYAYRPSLETSIGVVLYNLSKGEKRFLLLQYPHGHWDFVKGHKEKGESDEDTLRREVMEETGIQNLKRIHFYPKKRIFYFYKAKGTEIIKRVRRGNGLFIFKQVIYYSAETKDVDIHISDEHIGWRWFLYDEALKKLTFENSKNVLKQLKIT